MNKYQEEIKYSYNGYLTEDKLYTLLSSIVYPNNIQREVTVPGTRYRSDFLINYQSKKYIVEFYGDSHFRDPDVIFQDNEKIKIWNKYNRQVLTIPYFIQLDSDIWCLLFKSKITGLKIDYPHGFIDKKARLPSSFCPLGYELFLGYIKSLIDANYIRCLYKIIKSLKEKEATKKCEFIYFDNNLINYISNLLDFDNINLILSMGLEYPELELSTSIFSHENIDNNLLLNNNTKEYLKLKYLV